MRGDDHQQKGWLLPYLRQHVWTFTAALLLGALALCCAGALLFTSGYLISRSALRPENILMVYVPIVLVRTFGFGKAIIQYVERLTGHDAALRVLSRMRVRLYRALEPQALQLQTRFRTGDLLGLLAEDIEKLQNGYLKFLLPSLTSVLIYAAGIAALGRLDRMLALMMALYCGFLLFLLPCMALMASLRQRRRAKQVRSEAYQELTDAMFGMSDWILSGRIQPFLQAFFKKQESSSQIENSLRRNEWRINWISQCGIGVAVIIMTLWAGWLAEAGTIHVTWIAALALIAFPLLEAMVRAAGAVAQLPEYQTSLKRLQAIENVHSTDARIFTYSPAPQLSSVLPEEGVLDLQGVSFRYSHSREWAVHDISLQLPQGGKIAILGRSGSGKSTLLNLIQGELQPDEGSVKVNGIPVNAEDGNLNSFSVLNQNPYLFDTSVANNIRLGRPEASDEEVRMVTEQVRLNKLIESLPDGYNTRMEETGLRFSGGEKQRIALARILLQNHPIVLLDEPTVGLDPRNERELMRTVFRVLHGKTVVWVTHHLSGMEEMDEVIFMDQGSISMRGTHEQLMRGNLRYRKLYELDCPLQKRVW
ncbi:ATP-binding cassette, subfamily C, CydC [Paenibacillus algorifonticola]|uniref:ATP-binding cassette, subfamily C, CydC n=1 Tax=Paenibacillus algorifonticola TaxID=684063 RepID=A0A1I1YX49_9BACL|nr:thiol reductant ABC exporter subunit CydC [Paenibacillus algorifonticola]SFE24136.1 ATP-binding cassette, subfamily C, CydC [Paenibacillus algorifonticola]